MNMNYFQIPAKKRLTFRDINSDPEFFTRNMQENRHNELPWFKKLAIIKSVVLEKTGVTNEQLISNNRKAHIVQARHFCHYFGYIYVYKHKLTPEEITHNKLKGNNRRYISFANIAEKTTLKSPWQVMHSKKSIIGWMENKDHEIIKLHNRINARLGSSFKPKIK